VTEAISSQVRSELLLSGFPARVPAGSGVVGTGGTLTTVRAMVAARTGVRLPDAEAVLPVELLRAILSQVGPLPLEERRAVPGLAASRADVFPAALVTLLALAELSGIAAFHHSFRNLRWGVASELLSGA
jgi:exopolyphosphatase/guanosine-5'-triphosphate,3'-diphosphate pyrophosphatase